MEIKRKRSTDDGTLNSNCWIWNIYNYFIFVRLPTHLWVNNIRAAGVLNNANALSLGTNSCKKGTWPLWAAHIKQKSSVTLTVVSYNNNRAVYIASSESCEPNKVSRCWSKVLRKCMQEQQPNQFQCYNQSKSFVNRMDQSVVPVCLNGRCCSSGCVGIVSC